MLLRYRPTASLCSKNEYTKSESNSQLSGGGELQRRDCVQRTNIQNLKAIHNSASSARPLSGLCSKNEYTKSESNSQHFYGRVRFKMIVFKERIYKI